MDPIIHIGFHKTATTYLQRSIFTNTDVFETPWAPQSGRAIEQFVLVHPEQFDPQAVRAALAAQIKDPTKVPVLSHEALSGNPIYGRYYMDRVAQRLHATFPSARIVIGIREQKSLLLSLYFQYIKQGGTRSLHDLLQINRDREGYRPTVRLDFFEYDLTIAHYARLFGADNLLVLPIEQLRKAPDLYFERLNRFVGVTGDYARPEKIVNARRSDKAMQLERFVNRFAPVPEERAARYADNPLWFRMRNRFLRSSDRVLGRIAPSGGTGLQAEISDIVGGYFAGSNTRTATLTGLDLGGMGYPV